MDVAPQIRPTTARLSAANRWDHILARWGVNRSGHRVAPGLYALGKPTPDSPVFVTANYTLSFDALRSALGGLDAYVLVLDTQGINVWCAAGKGTFGTDELVHRIEAGGLGQVVRHRLLILPQLGAPGMAAHEVKKRSGFRVEYGPVRADDLPEYLKTHEATAEMRRVRFDLRDRLAVLPVEIVHALLPLALVAGLLFVIGGLWPAASTVLPILAGLILFPILLPWLPTRECSTKGLFLGALLALPVAIAELARHPDAATWWLAGKSLAPLLTLTPVIGYLSLNFTGSTTFTSRTGVRHEIYRYIPVMAGLFGAGLILSITLMFV